MKIIITENQYKRLFEEEKILTIPGMHYFNNDWNLLMDFLNSKGNPKWRISDSLDLFDNKDVADLNNLISVGGNLILGRTNIKSLGNLKSVGGYLYLSGTPLSKKYTKEEIRKMVNVGGNIYY
jgi:hypothetical protein